MLLFSLLALLVSFATPAWAAGTIPQHDIRLSINVASGEVHIVDRIQLSGQTEYHFRLAPWLQIRQLHLNDIAIAVQTTSGGYLVALPGIEPQQLEFELRGQLPKRQDDRDDSSSHALDGSFLPAWDAWIPLDPASAIVFRLAVEVSGEQRAVATGKLLSESSEGAIYSAVFEQSRPGEAPSLFIGPYEVREVMHDGIRLRTWFHPGLDDYADTYLESAGTYIDRYRAVVGDYPYADFHVVSAPLPVGLGFAGLTYVDRRILRLPFMQTRSLAHEVLHSWWGNAVAVDYATGNWAEGLTTYLADYALERDKGADAARAMRVKWLRDYAALPESRDRAAREFRSKHHQAGQVIGYNKVAFVFHMLEGEIGSDAFDAGIRRLWRDHQFTTAGWHDLQRAFEASAQRDLDWFFRQWIDRPGAPRLSLGAHRVTAVEGGYRTRIELVQPVADFRFRLAVLLTTESGSETDEINIDATHTVLEWITPARPVSIHFDANRDLFRRLDRRETPLILRDVTLSPDTQTRIIGNPEFNDIAGQLARRMLDTRPTFLEAGQARAVQRPLLLIATRAQLDVQLKTLGIDPPATLPGAEHTASAWVTRFANGTPLLVVSADTTADLEALLRPLPHYGGQSYVLFNAGRAQHRGVWKIERGPLYRNLANP